MTAEEGFTTLKEIVQLLEQQSGGTTEDLAGLSDFVAALSQPPVGDRKATFGNNVETSDASYPPVLLLPTDNNTNNTAGGDKGGGGGGGEAAGGGTVLTPITPTSCHNTADVEQDSIKEKRRRAKKSRVRTNTTTPSRAEPTAEHQEGEKGSSRSGLLLPSPSSPEKAVRRKLLHNDRDGQAPSSPSPPKLLRGGKAAHNRLKRLKSKQNFTKQHMIDIMRLALQDAVAVNGHSANIMDMLDSVGICMT